MPLIRTDISSMYRELKAGLLMTGEEHEENEKTEADHSATGINERCSL